MRSPHAHHVDQALALRGLSPRGLGGVVTPVLPGCGSARMAPFGPNLKAPSPKAVTSRSGLRRPPWGEGTRFRGQQPPARRRRTADPRSPEAGRPGPSGQHLSTAGKARHRFPWDPERGVHRAFCVGSAMTLRAAAAPQPSFAPSISTPTPCDPGQVCCGRCDLPRETSLTTAWPLPCLLGSTPSFSCLLLTLLQPQPGGGRSYSPSGGRRVSKGSSAAQSEAART